MSDLKSSHSSYHSVDPHKVAESLGVEPQRGLSPELRRQRLAEYGPNLLPKSEGDTAFKIFLRQFHNPLVYVLLVSAALALVMGKAIDALVVLGVVLINSVIGFIQEFRAGKALEALSAMVPQIATIVEDSKVREVPGADLVPGDIVLLKSGDKVAADLRLLETKSLRIEEAALTGESVAAEKGAQAVAADAGLGDRTGMAFSGTLVVYGTARGVVVGTGSQTELGKISKLLSSTTQIDTPLTQSLARFGQWVSLGVVVVALLLMVVGYLRGFELADALLAAVTLAVAAIPEGLPAIVTITLAIGVKRMADRRAVIRKLPAVETLGSATVICSDKTGTLTRNEMTVTALWTPKGPFELSGDGYKPEGQLLRDGVPVSQPPDEVWALLKSGVLCNDSQIHNQQVQGDPTEAALLVAFEKLGGLRSKLDSNHPRQDTQAFESELQYMATLHQDFGLIIKGAPEVVLGKCGLKSRQDLIDEIHRLAARGLRVLAFAKKPHSAAKFGPQDLESGFEFLGFQGMIDPPRQEVIAAVKDCHAAGITVKMITGDHKVTAAAIAREIGIEQGKGAISGEELASLGEDEFLKAAAHYNVFARVTPEQKLRLVRALQDQKWVAAMTGDGVNDAPALKQANIGIAMGITGTSVSKEAADVVLTDDNFTSIRSAVEEGRRIYDNLVKSLAFVLPTNLGEALIILVAVAAFPVVAGHVLMPILPVQILWINLVATVALALPLAFEAPERDIMQRPPRKVSEPILNAFVFWRTTLVAVLMAIGAVALFWYEFNMVTKAGVGHSEALSLAQTMAVTTVIFFQIFYLFNCRSLKGSMWSVGLFSNSTVYIGIGILLVLQVAFVHWPVMNQLFASSPLDAWSWIKSALAGAIVLPVIAIEKWWRSRRAVVGA